MSKNSVKGVTIQGVSCAVPRKQLDNQSFLDRFDEKTIADVAKLTGVLTRHIAEPGQTAGDLCFAAAERLLADLQWAPDSVDALIFVSQTPDQRMPATACILHGRLGLSTECQAFDVGLGCSGYVYGTWLAAALISAGLRRVLLLAGDTSSQMLDPDDRGTAMLFGDAGSATAFEYNEHAPLTYFELGTDGTGAQLLTVPAGGYRLCGPASARDNTLHMDGSAVFGFTISTVPPLIKSILQQANLTIGDVDTFALHQANKFILQHIEKKLKIPAGALPINIEQFGNTSSASVPLLLCTNTAERITGSPTTLLMAGFGVGLSWGAAVFSDVRLQSTSVFEV